MRGGRGDDLSEGAVEEHRADRCAQAGTGTSLSLPKVRHKQCFTPLCSTVALNMY